MSTPSTRRSTCSRATAKRRSTPQFDGTTYDTILWQAACHYRAQQIGPKSKQLMELTGAKVTMVERCSAIDGTWGLRAENLEMAKRVAKPLMDKVRESDDQLVAGDCHLANNAIKEAGGQGAVAPDAGDGPRLRDRRLCAS